MPGALADQYFVIANNEGGHHLLQAAGSWCCFKPINLIIDCTGSTDVTEERSAIGALAVTCYLDTVVSYSEKVLDHFQHPRNVGEIEGADANVRVDNPVCGDIMDLAVKLSGDRIAEVRFRAKGCVPSIAAGSCLTEMIHGRSLREAQAIKREQIVEALDGLPPASMHASHLAMDALAQLLKKLSR
jgi:nitrogen fixation protein NifU and related proteins